MNILNVELNSLLGGLIMAQWSDNDPIVDVKIGRASLIKINSNTILNYIRERLSSNRVSKIIIYI